MIKSELRKDIIKKLNKLTVDERGKIERSLAEHLMTSDIWKQADTIGITISHGFEWNTKPIIETAWKEGKTVCVPKCIPEKRHMTFYCINNYDQLEIVYNNLLEPKPELTDEIAKNKIDLLVVPGLLFDRNGYRVGFGGGYYDRFLIDFDNYKLSLAANVQLVEELPVESFDIPVDKIVTEHGFVAQEANKHG